MLVTKEVVKEALQASALERCRSACGTLAASYAPSIAGRQGRTTRQRPSERLELRRAAALPRAGANNRRSAAYYCGGNFCRPIRLGHFTRCQRPANCSSSGEIAGPAMVRNRGEGGGRQADRLLRGRKQRPSRTAQARCTRSDRRMPASSHRWLGLCADERRATTFRQLWTRTCGSASCPAMRAHQFRLEVPRFSAEPRQSSGGASPSVTTDRFGPAARSSATQSTLGSRSIAGKTSDQRREALKAWGEHLTQPPAPVLQLPTLNRLPSRGKARRRS